MRVAAIQCDILWEEPRANFERAEVEIAAAATDGVRLVVLPEMFATGFSMDAEHVARYGDDTRFFLSEMSRRHGVWTIGGYADRGTRKPHNVASLFDPDGVERLRYLKIHPFSMAKEHDHYEGGIAAGMCEVEGVRVTMAICYDLRFPEPFRALAGRTDLFCIIANWPSPRRNAWRALLTARAIENQVYVLGVNRIGEGGGLEYSGDSALIDPMGETIATAAHQPATVTGDVDPRQVGDIRHRFPFLADRRPDIYAHL